MPKWMVVQLPKSIDEVLAEVCQKGSKARDHSFDTLIYVDAESRETYGYKCSVHNKFMWDAEKETTHA